MRRGCSHELRDLILWVHSSEEGEIMNSRAENFQDSSIALQHAHYSDVPPPVSPCLTQVMLLINSPYRGQMNGMDESVTSTRLPSRDHPFSVVNHSVELKIQISVFDDVQYSTVLKYLTSTNSPSKTRLPAFLIYIFNR